MSSVPLEQLEQTLERSIENVRQVINFHKSTSSELFEKEVFKYQNNLVDFRFG